MLNATTTEEKEAVGGGMHNVQVQLRDGHLWVQDRLSVFQPRRSLSFELRSLPIRYTTVTQTALKKVFVRLREFFCSRAQGDEMSIILGTLPTLLIPFHVFRYLMESFVDFC